MCSLLFLDSLFYMFLVSREFIYPFSTDQPNHPFLTVFSLLFLPGIYAHGMITKLGAFLEPYCGQLIANVKEQLNKKGT